MQPRVIPFPQVRVLVGSAPIDISGITGMNELLDPGSLVHIMRQAEAHASGVIRHPVDMPDRETVKRVRKGLLAVIDIPRVIGSETALFPRKTQKMFLQTQAGFQQMVEVGREDGDIPILHPLT